MRDFSSVHMNKAEQLYTTSPAAGWRIPNQSALISGIYKPLQVNTHPRFSYQHFIWVRLCPMILKVPFFDYRQLYHWFAITFLVESTATVLKYKKKSLKKPIENPRYRDWHSYCVSIHPKTVLQTSRKIFCFALKGMGFPVFSLLTQVNVVQDCQSPRCCPCWLLSSDISFANCLLQPFSSEPNHCFLW